MNKFVIVALAVVVVAVSAQGPPPMSPELKQYMEECKAANGATDDDLKGMMAHQPPTNKGWCVIGCMKQKTGVMGADNKINMEKLEQEMSGMKSSHPDRYEKLKAALTTCKTQVESNTAAMASTCTAAKAFGECVHGQM